MKFQSTTFFAAALALFLASATPASAQTQSDPGQQAATIVGKHVIRFTEPAKRIPSTVSVDAPLLGNGFTGVALSGPPEAQVFYVARNDFWRLKSEHDSGYAAGLGKIALNIPQLKEASFLVEQNLYDATTTGRFQKDDIIVTYKMFIAATEDVMVLELNLNGKESVEGKIELTAFGEKEFTKKTMDRGIVEIKQPDNNGIQSLTRSFEKDVDIPTKAVIALHGDTDQNGNFVLKQGKPTRFTFAFSSNFKSPDFVKLAEANVLKYKSDWRALEQAHKQWWKNYWEKSFVSIPDNDIERQYYLSLYGTASCSRDLDFPPPIFGTWITKEYPSWAGDYHFNYNHMAPFYALYSANRIEQAEPYSRPVLAAVERGKYYSQKITGIPDGILLPVGFGPLGVETTRYTPEYEKKNPRWRKSGAAEDVGCFWGQKSNSAYAVVNFSMQFYHTWDADFAKRVYPFVKGVATFWEKYLKYENGRYVIYNDAIHEGSIGTKNAILSLGLVRLLMQTSLDMSQLLNVDEARREKWTHIKNHLSDYTFQEKAGKTVFRYSEQGAPWWEGNTLGIQHIYPSGQIGLDSDSKLLTIAQNTLSVMNRWLDFNGSNSFFPAAVRVGYNPEIIFQQLKRYSNHTYKNGYQLGNPHGIENWSTVPNTVNEMLCMGHQDVVRLFSAWPKDKDAEFYQIRVEGAFLVSAKLKNREVSDVTILSERGRDLNLLNPWKNRKFKIKQKSTDGTIREEVREGERIKIKTIPDATYLFEPL